ncbi:MAG: hypothetical protein JSU64_08360 [candidate division WOR-3 bacterium]|nr:MAG: hypothetical protein JSU64_08360 [candidate division WOR-3 bacterium]
MISIVAEGIFLCSAWCLYWLCRDRRRYLKRRIGRNAFRNVFQVARNISFMLSRKELVLRGNTGILNGGCVLYSFHYGVWESMPYTLRRLGYRIGVIVNRYGRSSASVFARLSDRLLLRWRAGAGTKVFYADNLLEIVRFIKSGGVFGILVDGNTFFQKHEKARKLSEICGVPLVPFAAYRRRDEGILHIGCDLTAMVMARPLDYVWAYKSR